MVGYTQNQPFNKKKQQKNQKNVFFYFSWSVLISKMSKKLVFSKKNK